jgi:hypothetical protein
MTKIALIGIFSTSLLLYTNYKLSRPHSPNPQNPNKNQKIPLPPKIPKIPKIPLRSKNPKNPLQIKKSKTIPTPFSYKNLFTPSTQTPTIAPMQHTQFPSGLEWLHIEDKTTQICSLCISLQIGSWHELTTPSYPPGTAHLLEHSVFLLETEKFKQKILYSNAFTDDLYTVYMDSTAVDNFFDVFKEKLNLVQNLRFFKFGQKSNKSDKEEEGKPSAFDEVSAVESEFKIAIENIFWKNEFILARISPSNNAVSKVINGNERSLKFENIGEKVFEFYKAFYSLEKMKVISYCDSGKLAEVAGVPPEEVGKRLEGMLEQPAFEPVEEHKGKMLYSKISVKGKNFQREDFEKFEMPVFDQVLPIFVENGRCQKSPYKKFP